LADCRYQARIRSELARVREASDVTDRRIDVCGHEFADAGDCSQASDDVDVFSQRSDLHIDVGTFLGEQRDADQACTMTSIRCSLVGAVQAIEREALGVR
jgi:hypothetical protein